MHSYHHHHCEKSSKIQRKHPKIMMSLENMLNPVEDEVLLTPISSHSSLPASIKRDTSPPLKKQKLAKDAPVFVAGNTRGPVRYPPFSSFTKTVHAELARFNINPSAGEISEYPRHIPYSSAKKGFQEKTGRDAFEVFHYTFENIEDKKEHVVMWDYNIGLVRITPFFKCCGYAKTVPGKMLASNPGLKDICHSITGGALAAQGYWMPYNAARAMAKTFCYHIRYALVPLFGADFAEDCMRPGQEGFRQITIDPIITENCTRQAAVFCEQDKRSYDHECERQDVRRGPVSPASRSSRMSTPIFTEPVYEAPNHDYSGIDAGGYRHIRQRGSRHIDYVRSQWMSPTPSGSERERRNAFAAPPEDFRYLPSPKSDAGRGINGMSAGCSAPRSHPDVYLPSPCTIMGPKIPTKGYHVPPNSPSSLNDDASYLGNTGNGEADDSDNGSAAGAVSPKSQAKTGNLHPHGEPNQADSPSYGNSHRQLPAPVFNTRPSGNGQTCTDDSFDTYKAAWMLFQLHMIDSKLRKDVCGGANAPTTPLETDQIQQDQTGTRSSPSAVLHLSPIFTSISARKRRAST